MCVCCLGGEEIYGRGAHMAARQSLQSVLLPVTQELPAMSIVWSQVTFPMKLASLQLAAKHSAPGPVGIPDCYNLRRCWALEGRSSPA